MNNGKLIIFEGVDGCGKSTHLELAYKERSRNAQLTEHIPEKTLKEYIEMVGGGNE